VVGALAVVTALGLGAVIQNIKQNSERSFLTNYVLALYGIKSGFDRGSAISNNLVEDWQHQTTISNSTPEPDIEELIDLEKVRGEVVKLMQKMNKPPKPLKGAYKRLERLNAVYEQQNRLASKPRGSLDDYRRALQATQKGFVRTLEELKAALPPPLREEIKKASNKYNLRFME
jgi:hypothetical protein